MKSAVVVLSLVLATVSAVSVNFLNCPAVPAGPCEIVDVDIDPCKENPKPCRLKKGSDASISVKFNPKFDASNLTIGVYWASGSGVEPGFPDLDSNGCEYTTCPTVSGQEQVYNYKLHLAKKLPKGNFQTKWKIWDANNEANMCCFLATIQLYR